jgi:methyl-accepting chemotaxis protein
MHWKNMKIGTRLALGFGALVALLAIVAAITLSRIGVLDDEIGLTNADRYPKTVLAHLVKDKLGENAVSLRNLLLLDDGAAIKAELLSIADNTRDIGAALARLESSIGPGPGRVLFDQLKQVRRQFLDGRQHYLELYQRRELDLARAAMQSEIGPAQRRYYAILDQLIAHQSAMMDESGRRSAEIAAATMRLVALLTLAGVLIGALVGWFATRSITRPLRRAVQIAGQVAEGDLSGRIEVDSGDETGQLLQALQTMSASLAGIAGQVRQGAAMIAHASTEIAAGNLDLSARTEQQAASLEETAASMEQLTSTVRNNTESAQQANQLAVSAADVAAKGGAIVAQVVDTMNSISASSRKIADIISVIDGIAFQTNILALNAAVEAARAGEQGRGFAVVATEVRNLAQRAAAAAKEIKCLIDESVGEVEAGGALVSRAGSTMEEIVNSVQRVTDIMGEITVASQEQEAGIKQVNTAIGQMDDVTQQNAALVEQAAAAASAMHEHASQLAEVVSVFKLGGSAGRPTMALSSDMLRLAA